MNALLMKNKKSEEGFTLIELLVVILIIGVLAAIALPIFLNQQKAAFSAHAKSDLRQLEQAINLAKIKTNKPLPKITLSTCTACAFGSEDPLKFAETQPGTGWVTYKASLQRISDASGIDVTGLRDAHGRPYYMDENEGEGGNCNARDRIASYDDSWGNGSTTNSISITSGSFC